MYITVTVSETVTVLLVTYNGVLIKKYLLGHGCCQRS